MAQNIAIIAHKDDLPILGALIVLICLEGRDKEFTITTQGDKVIGFSHQYPPTLLQIPYLVTKVDIPPIYPEHFRGVIPDKYHYKHNRR